MRPERRNNSKRSESKERCVQVVADLERRKTEEEMRDRNRERRYLPICKKCWGSKKVGASHTGRGTVNGDEKRIGMEGGVVRFDLVKVTCVAIRKMTYNPLGSSMVIIPYHVGYQIHWQKKVSSNMKLMARSVSFLLGPTSCCFFHLLVMAYI